MATAYEMPGYGGDGSRLLGWLNEAVQEANGWLQTQKPAGEWEQVLRMFGPDNGGDVKGMSNLGYNLVERNARDIVASLANFRHEGEYRPTFETALYDRAHTLTKIDRAWAQKTHLYDTRRNVLQYGVAFGTGYMVTDYDKYAYPTHGDVRERAFGPDAVTFVQLPNDHDIQKAYMVIIKEELPINYARFLYGSVAGRLTPDRGSPSWIQKGLQKVQRLMGGSPALAVAGMGGQNQNGAFPTVDVFHAYTLDRSINESGSPKTMGTRDTNWTYTVPSVGDPVNLGIINPATGQSFTRPAEPADCMMFPLRRYTIWTRTATIYDGSSPWWHAGAPVSRFRLNDWAWEALGRSLMAPAQTMQDGIVALMRYVEDTCAVQLDPALLYDDTLVSEGFAQNYNPRLAGSRAAASLNTGGDIVKFPVPPGTYRVDATILQHLKDQEQRINHQMGTPDLVAMAKAKQVPGQGTLEKLMEMAGPLVDDMVRAQQVPYTENGEWRKALYFQFYTRNRFIKSTGPDPEENEEFEFTPDALIGRFEGESVEARTARSKRLISEFTYHVEESSINERHRMANKLALLQLKKAGVKIDDWTIAEAFSLHNYGPKPEGTRNMIERFIAEKRMDQELVEDLQGGQPQGQKGPGRPNSNTKSPRIQSKDGGTRSTVTTS